MRPLRELVVLGAVAGCANQTAELDTVTSAIEAGPPPAPTYTRIITDNVTGDNATVVVPGGGAGQCSMGQPCWIAEPDADSYSEDLYERPAGQGSLARNYAPAIDIVTGQTGSTSQWLFYKINLFGPQPGQSLGSSASMPFHYGIEINFDDDVMGDLIIDVDNTSLVAGVNWSAAGITVKADSNETMGGNNPLLPDGPGNGGGYEHKYFDSGMNTASQAPGGTTAVQARINGASLEIAMYRPFIEALTPDAVTAFAFRPYADANSVDTNELYAHDVNTRTGIGSPYPWLRLTGAPVSCPSGSGGDGALTAAQRLALESGTNINTGIANPCYATGGIYMRDNAGTVHDLATKDDLQVRVDVRLTKDDALDPVSPGSPIVYTLTASNMTTGTLTNVVITDPLPATTVFVSASPGCTYQTLGHTVTCAVGTLAPMASTAVTITVLSTVPGTVSNTATATSDGDEQTPNNNTDTETTTVAVLCGNGNINTGEVCDDGNNTNGDGCNNDCRLSNGQPCTGDNQCSSGACDENGSMTCEPANTCGNGTIEISNNEFCDDGNTTSGDGCEANCKLPDGTPCTGDDQCASGECDEIGSGTCEPAASCGNGTINPGEVCDDGNNTGGDGCEADCKLSNGEECDSDDECNSGVCDDTSGVCEPANSCGNAVREGTEVCDDGNTVDNDGCDADCKLSDGEPCDDDDECSSGACDDTSDVCEPAAVCGNGTVDAGEGCDDGGTTPGDGCNAECKIEDGFPCDEDPECASGMCDEGTDSCGGRDTDGDTIYDYADIDDDNDGLLDTSELGDTDGDFTPDSLDLDSDDDGIPDATEAGHRFDDRDGNFVIDCPAAFFGNNGLCNSLETAPDNGIADFNGDGTADAAALDSDGDGVPNYRDLDSDNDSIADVYEGGSNCPDTNVDGVCDGEDDDRDGIVNALDVAISVTATFGTLNAKLAVDTDGDGQQDSRDLDSDGDGVFDIQESKNAMLDMITDGVVDAVGDRDDDGVRDVADDSDLDSFDDAIDPDPAAFGGLRHAPVDTDDDGAPDFQDTDSDDDGPADGTDNCRIDVNPDQLDSDGDDIGDACDGNDDRTWGVSGGCGCQTSGGSSGSLLFALAVLGIVLRPRRRRILSAVAPSMVVAALVLYPTASHAQQVEGDFGTERFLLSSDRDGILDVESGVVRRHLSLDFAFWLGYQNDPLVLNRTDMGREEVGAIVSDQVSGELIAALGLFDQAQIGIAIPLVVLQNDDLNAGPMAPTAPNGSFAIGDIRLIPKYQFLKQGSHAVNLAVFAALTVPTSSGEGFSGDDGVTFAPALALSRSWDTGMRFASNLGWRTRKQNMQLDLEVNDEIFAAAGLGYDFATRGGPPVGLDATFGLATAADDMFGAFNRNYAEFKLGASVDFKGPLLAFAAAGAGVAEGWGTPDWRALAGIRIDRTTSEEPEKVIPDTDGDGYRDNVDGCPQEPEDFDRFEDENGCPDTDDDKDTILDVNDKCRMEPEDLDQFEDDNGCPDPDNDLDTLLDAADKCPNEPEDMDAFQDEDGCPDTDNDQDTVLDAQDECPEVAGPVDNKGCPWPDRDGDGVIDRFDNCPTWKGTAENNGCASKQLVKITESKLELYETTWFATGKATIQRRSFRMLDQVAMVLKAHTDLQISIEGHTDSVGSNAMNLKLSKARAAAVMKYLVKKGVDQARLSSEGFGEERPVADNKTAKGRAQNRRVDFMATRIVETTTTTTVPGQTGPATPADPTAPAQPAGPAQPAPKTAPAPALEKP